MPEQEKQFDNFDIRIYAAEDGYGITAESDFGETVRATIQALPGGEDFEDAAYYLRELMSSEEDAQQFGAQLYQFLFPPTVQSFFDKSLGYAKGKGNGLRIRLRLTADLPILSRIPWEYCQNQKDSFFALDRETPLVRYLHVDEPPLPIKMPETMRVLFVTANPNRTGELDIAAEESRLQDALQSLITKNRVELQSIHHTTRQQLSRAVQQFKPHIVHYSGHGGFNGNGEACLWFEDEQGESDAIDAKSLRTLLKGSDVQLAVLNACQTADHETTSLFSGVAQGLVRVGLPAALGMQFVVPDAVGHTFTQVLYQQLVAGVPLDTAVTEARITIHFDHDKTTYWGIPVLFMRARDGVLWNAGEVTLDQYLQNAAEKYASVRTESGAKIPLTGVYVMLQAQRSESPKPAAGRDDLAEDEQRREHAGMEAQREEKDKQDKQEEQEEQAKPAPLFSALKEKEHLVILGEPGGGKSIALQYIALYFSQKETKQTTATELDGEERIPILISLKEHTELLPQKGLEATLAAALQAMSDMNEAEALANVQAWRNAGRLAVLLDGLDEVADYDVREKMVTAISIFAKSKEGQKCRVVLTSRTTGYNHELGDPFQEYMILPFATAAAATPYVAGWLAVLQGWNGEQREDADEAAELLVTKLNEQAGLSRILDNPMLLRLAVELYVETGEIVAHRFGLYQRYTEKIAKRNALNRGADKLLLKEAIPALECIGWAAHTGKTRQVDALLPILQNAGIANPDEMVMMLREQMGLLIFEGSSVNRNVYFSHWTFQEYFVARQLKKLWDEDRTKFWTTMQPCLHHPAWCEPLFLFAGSLAKADAERLIQGILKAKSFCERDLHRDYFLAAELVSQDIGATPEMTKTISDYFGMCQGF